MPAPASACWRRGPPTGTPTSTCRPASSRPSTTPASTGAIRRSRARGPPGRRIFSPRGKTLGGSSSINGHIYNRGQRQDFDTWAQIGNRGWGYADVLPYFKRLERRIGEGDADLSRPRRRADRHRHRLARSPVRGLHRRRGEPRHPAQSRLQRRHPGRRLLRAAHDPQRAARQRRDRVPAPGHAAAEPPCAHGTRTRPPSCSTASARSACAMRKGGRGGAPAEVRARKEVILAGGTYNSPQLLQLSGIGPAPLLPSLGIDGAGTRLAGVGEGLQDHYAPRSVARVKNIKTINERARGLNLAARGAASGARRGAAFSRSRRRWSIASGIPARRPKAPTCSSPSRPRATRRASRASWRTSPA